MKDEVIIELEVLNKCLQYLMKRPYVEVYQIIQDIHKSARELPKEEISEESE